MRCNEPTFGGSEDHCLELAKGGATVWSGLQEVQPELIGMKEHMLIAHDNQRFRIPERHRVEEARARPSTCRAPTLDSNRA